MKARALITWDMAKRAGLYGLALAAGTFALQWLDYQRVARTHLGDAYVALIAIGFMGLGIYLGVRLFGAPASIPTADGNPAAQATLGISGRELEVLRELAAGYSNKEIALRLSVSPNTVK